jgi:SET domain-containing protein
VNALKKGTFVGEYVGEIVTHQELYERNNERAAKKERHTYPALLDADLGSERTLEGEEALCLDATEFGNIGRFINHRYFHSPLVHVAIFLCFFLIKKIFRSQVFIMNELGYLS